MNKYDFKAYPNSSPKANFFKLNFKCQKQIKCESPMPHL